MIRTAIIIALMMCSSASAAQTFMNLGQGALSCGRWATERRQNNFTLFPLEAWILGYLTAYNAWSENAPADVSKGTDVAGLFAWIDNYCASNPIDDIATASAHLVKTLSVRSGHSR